MPYANVILNAVAKSGRSNRDVSLQAVGHESAIHSLKRGLDARASTLEALCDALDLEFYIGPPRGTAPAESPALSTAVPGAITDMLGLPEGAEADVVVAAIREKLAARGTAAAAASPAAALDRRTLERTLDSKLDDKTRALRDEMAAMREDITSRLPPHDADGRAMNIRRLALRQAPDVRAAGGVGEEIFDEAATATLYIADDDLPPNLDSDRLVAIRAAGHSMAPTIQDQDILVLNPDATEPREGSVFVIHTDTGLVVKRLRREGTGDQEGWIMTSDAPDWEPRPVTGQDRIVGHVVWFGPEGAVVVNGSQKNLNQRGDGNA